MKSVLVLGAGLVARPLVNDLIARPNIAVTVADVEAGRAAKLVEGRPQGRALDLDITDKTALAATIGTADVVISMLPNTLHPAVAELALELGKPMLTASYVSPAMRALDARARQRNVLLLNELGLDPGIDHMEAMRIIHAVHQAGGSVMSFSSWCGGLPAPDANDNPFGYKFSWSPRGVLLASKNSARFLKDGRVVVIPDAELLSRPERIAIPGLGDFEGYPNRDSLAYREIYGIPECRSVFRGTLRYPGWCETLKSMVQLGLLDERPRDRAGVTWNGLMRECAQPAALADIRDAVASSLKLDPRSAVLSRFEWLGLFEDAPLPLPGGSALDNLTVLMRDKLRYEAGERDMIVLRHDFLIRTAAGREERILSTLIDFGEPGGDTSMSRTVGLPVAIGARLILEGRIGLAGVRVPVEPEIYAPILEELERIGIRFIEERRTV